MPLICGARASASKEGRKGAGELPNWAAVDGPRWGSKQAREGLGRGVRGGFGWGFLFPLFFSFLFCFIFFQSLFQKGF